MKSILAIVATISLSGCASQLQAVKGFNAAAAVSLKAATDINLERLTFELCATPYSALVRNPQLVPGVAAICLPGGNTANPATLLMAIPPAAKP